jgi:hypothetical protein
MGNGEWGIGNGEEFSLHLKFVGVDNVRNQ